MKKKKTNKTVKKSVKKAKKKVVTKKTAPKTKKKEVVKLEKQRVKKVSSVPIGASLEETGIITHYYPKVNAAVVKLTKGSLSVGDNIVIKGHTSDFKEKVVSIQLDHMPIQNA